MVKSEQLYTPQQYLEEVTGKYYCIVGDNDIVTITALLSKNGYSLNNYPLSKIDYIVENKLNVVLVDCLVYNEKAKEFKQVLQWFEIQKRTTSEV